MFPACQASLFISNSQSLLKLMSIESVIHPTTSSSVVPFSSCPQSFPGSESFQRSQLFTWGGQSTGVSASASVLPMNTQDWFPLGLTGWISLQSKGLSRVFSSSKASILRCSAFFTVQLTHPYMTIGKTIALTRQTFAGKVTPLLFNMLSRLVIALLPRSKHLNFLAAVTICSDFGDQENKVCHCFPCFPIYLPWSDGMGCHDLSFLNVEQRGPKSFLKDWEKKKKKAYPPSLGAFLPALLLVPGHPCGHGA